MSTRKTAKPTLTARTADRHELYEQAVQNPESEANFISRQFQRLRGRPLRTVREDFCGTAAVCAEWVARHQDNIAYGLDLHQPTLNWAKRHRLPKLTPDQLDRIHLIRGNVLSPPRHTAHVDAVLAMNFSYWIFRTREELIRYFKTVRRTMASDGIFFLDQYGGWEALREQTDRRRCKGFTYLWEQHRFEPLTFHAICKIHFKFPDGSMMRNAFTYHWRMWQIPELRECLLAAGFKRVRIYWEGDGKNGGGNGIFRETTNPDMCPVSVSYLSAEK